MKNTYRYTLTTGAVVALIGLNAMNGMAGADSDSNVPDALVAEQRANLAVNTSGAGFGPQAPRDFEITKGINPIVFDAAPDYTEMNLCNIHMHDGAEHKGGEFTNYLGNGDGKGYGTGFGYSGELSDTELASIDYQVGKHGLVPGDTIEVHYVHSTAQVVPGPTLGACLSESIKNPQLRVEAQVFVLVNDESALDFTELTAIGEVDGFQQALNIPSTTGETVEYAGSTTGPGYNESGSPFQVTWNVRPNVEKVYIRTVADWFDNNVFDEDHAHGVRNLVMNPELLAPIVN